jgi:hypothetical protein
MGHEVVDDLSSDTIILLDLPRYRSFRNFSKHAKLSAQQLVDYKYDTEKDEVVRKATFDFLSNIKDKKVYLVEH